MSIIKRQIPDEYLLRIGKILVCKNKVRHYVSLYFDLIKTGEVNEQLTMGWLLKDCSIHMQLEGVIHLLCNQGKDCPKLREAFDTWVEIEEIVAQCIWGDWTMLNGEIVLTKFGIPENGPFHHFDKMPIKKIDGILVSLEIVCECIQISIRSYEPT